MPWTNLVTADGVVVMTAENNFYKEGYSGGGFEGIECECCSDGLLECFQGSPVGCVEDSPRLDVGDDLLDHLADLVDAPVLLLRLLVEFAVGGFLCGVIIPLPT